MSGVLRYLARCRRLCHRAAARRGVDRRRARVAHPPAVRSRHARWSATRSSASPARSRSPPEPIVLFALLLVGLKLMVGAFLLAALFSAAYEKMRFGAIRRRDARRRAVHLGARQRRRPRCPACCTAASCWSRLIGELMLCVIASGLAIYGRGYLVQGESSRVRPARAGPLVRRAPSSVIPSLLFLQQEAEHRVGVVVRLLDIGDVRGVEHASCWRPGCVCG